VAAIANLHAQLVTVTRLTCAERVPKRNVADVVAGVGAR
jgi:hypothetical protein